ncbi:MAG TPA: hemolysin family protein [Micromonosporaceae bacterium]|nr:hemolysin family protein [Micromonosporaceae bacterium]
MDESGRAGPLRRWLARVVVRGADGATRLVTRLLGASPTSGREQISEAELRGLVAANTLLDREEQRIIDGVIAAGASLVREVMVPRTEVMFLDAALSVGQAAQAVRDQSHSRFPVVDGTHDDVIGFVHLRDLLIRPNGEGPATVADLTRDVKRLPATKRVLAALSEMRREGHHLAVIIDEYGGTAGIVTLEDLIEELIGEIHDEYDAEPEPVPASGTVPAEVEGRLNLADFTEWTGLVLPTGPYETVGGFLMARLGRLPTVGDEVRLPAVPTAGAAPASGGAPGNNGGRAGWLLRVAALDGRRVARVALVPAPPPSPPEAGPAGPEARQSRQGGRAGQAGRAPAGAAGAAPGAGQRR